jgi:HK97 gp10 family phage protein
MLERQPLARAKGVIRESLTVASKIMERGMIAEAPVYIGLIPNIPPGFLAQHINTRITVRNNLVGSAAVGPQARIDYPKTIGDKIRKRAKGTKTAGRIAVLTVARFLEYGTSKMEANPFISRAFLKYRAACEASLIENLRKLIPPGLLP